MKLELSAPQVFFYDKPARMVYVATGEDDEMLVRADKESYMHKEVHLSCDEDYRTLIIRCYSNEDKLTIEWFIQCRIIKVIYE